MRATRLEKTEKSSVTQHFFVHTPMIDFKFRTHFINELLNTLQRAWFLKVEGSILG